MRRIRHRINTQHGTRDRMHHLRNSLHIMDRAQDIARVSTRDQNGLL